MSIDLLIEEGATYLRRSRSKFALDVNPSEPPSGPRVLYERKRRGERVEKKYVTHYVKKVEKGLMSKPEFTVDCRDKRYKCVKATKSKKKTYEIIDETGKIIATLLINFGKSKYLFQSAKEPYNVLCNVHVGRNTVNYRTLRAYDVLTFDKEGFPKLHMHQKRPRCDQSGGFRLYFGGHRVVPSIKNTILMQDDSDEIMSVRKCDDHTLAVDCWPDIDPLQGFFVAIAAFLGPTI